MKAIVLNYSTGCVHICELPNDLVNGEDIENYLDLEEGFHLSDCHWMITNEDYFHVFNGNTSEFITNL